MPAPPASHRSLRRSRSSRPPVGSCGRSRRAAVRIGASVRLGNLFPQGFIHEHLESFLRGLSEQGRSLPRYVVEEFRGSLRCALLSEGFARCVCKSCGDELWWRSAARARHSARRAAPGG